eukprot:XP_015136054.1 uncharacterized protein LOC107052366 [Gallus gallus]
MPSLPAQKRKKRERGTKNKLNGDGASLAPGPLLPCRTTPLRCGAARAQRSLPPCRFCGGDAAPSSRTSRAPVRAPQSEAVPARCRGTSWVRVRRRWEQIGRVEFKHERSRRAQTFSVYCLVKHIFAATLRSDFVRSSLSRAPDFPFALRLRSALPQEKCPSLSSQYSGEERRGEERRGEERRGDPNLDLPFHLSLQSRGPGQPRALVLQGKAGSEGPRGSLRIRADLPLEWGSRIINCQEMDSMYLTDPSQLGMFCDPAVLGLNLGFSSFKFNRFYSLLPKYLRES